MRKIWTSTNKVITEEYSKKLDQYAIAHSVDVKKDLDWGSDSYGNIFFSIWIHEDTEVERSKALINEPFDRLEHTPRPFSSSSVSSILKPFLQVKFPHSFAKNWQPAEPIPMLTILLCIMCVLLYGIDRSQRHMYTSTIQKALLFDYSIADCRKDELLKQVGPDGLNSATSLDSEGTILRNQWLQTPYWRGLYSQLGQMLSKKNSAQALSFSDFAERIRTGEVWRLITPCFLHGGMFHLLFNMLWVIPLGTQIERKISSCRYLLLITSIASISNTAQYLMTGPYFGGISAVVCGMAGFISTRQRQAPWEGYNFNPLMYTSLLFVIWSLMILSIAGSFIEYYFQVNCIISFANTAHLTGLITGIMFGHSKWFAMTKLNNTC